MSLEDRIVELNASIGELTAAIKSQGAVAIVGKPAKEDAKPADRKAEPQAVEEEVPNAAPATDTTKPSGKASSEPAKEISYDEVRALIIAISRAAKSKAEATLAKFGVKNGKELKPEQYAEFVVYAAKVVEGEVDPEAGNA